MGFIAEVKIFDSMPKGWGVCNGATTAPSGYVWINNRKPLFVKTGKSQYEHAYLKI